MIRITKGSEPECLSNLKAQNDSVYNNLQGECLKEVRCKLHKEQKGLCAYCQKKIPFAFVEHYIAQSEDKRKQLDYDNFLGVCSGKYYINKKTGEAINYCSPNRGSTKLSINPLSSSDMSTIYYDENAEIKSTNEAFQDDLDSALNLNFDEICLERSYSFDEELEVVQNLALEMGLSQVDAYTRAIDSVSSRIPEYAGFLMYQFRKLLEYSSSSNA